jgi:hypothetical protein
MLTYALVAVQWFLFSIGLGFLLAAPFVALKREAFRVTLCVAVPVATYLVLAFLYCIEACSHPGPPPIVLLALTLGVALGGLGATRLRNLWLYVKARIGRRHLQ